ncbi:RICIN domain-containing protein [Streptomyces sp. NPDC057301]|uniref:RICIN domain-containing protein n=1 Tax=Streptomyces sp. NPDC057301 TaxID=3346093 RepID=UPI00363DCC9D
MAFTPGRTYRIRNKASDGLVVTPKGWSSGETQLQIYTLTSVGDGNRAKQVWHVMPLDNDDVMLINKRTGLCINVHNNSTAPSMGVQQYDIQSPEVASSQKWMLRPATSGYYTVVNKKSGLELTPQSWGTSPSTNLQQYTPGGPETRERQYWALEVEDEYPQITGLRPIDRDPNDIGDVIRLTGFTEPPRDTTPEVLIGQLAVPFFTIGDSSPQWQVDNSPYYILKRYGYWQKVFFYEHPGTSKVTKTKKVTVGLTTSTGKTVEETTGISVTAEASFAYKGFSASLSTTYSRELKVTTYTGEVHEHFTEDTIEREYQADGVRIAECLWYRGDRYTVERMDGTKVLEWNTLNAAVEVLDGYRP